MSPAATVTLDSNFAASRLRWQLELACSFVQGACCHDLEVLICELRQQLERFEPVPTFRMNDDTDPDSFTERIALLEDRVLDEASKPAITPAALTATAPAAAPTAPPVPKLAATPATMPTVLDHRFVSDVGSSVTVGLPPGQALESFRLDAGEHEHIHDSVVDFDPFDEFLMQQALALRKFPEWDAQAEGIFQILAATAAPSGSAVDAPLPEALLSDGPSLPSVVSSYVPLALSAVGPAGLDDDTWVNPLTPSAMSKAATTFAIDRIGAIMTAASVMTPLNMDDDTDPDPLNQVTPTQTRSTRIARRSVRSATAPAMQSDNERRALTAVAQLARMTLRTDTG